jgi:uncharacterized protein (DUF488 family)
MTARIWTIGHSTRTLEEFLALLRSHDIQSVADVRRFPASRKFPHFNAEALQASLAAQGIDYQPLPQLGGRRTPRADSPNVAWRNRSFRGYADYMETAAFADGLNALRAEAARKRTAVMCAEAPWWRCHRALISDYLKASGTEVFHIAGIGSAAPHPYTSAANLTGGRLTYASP